MKQITEKEWSEIASPYQLCTLEITLPQLASDFGFKLTSYAEHGLGKLEFVIVKIDNINYWLSSPHAQQELGTSVQIQSFEPDSKTALNKLLSELKLNENDLLWKNDYLGPAKWALYRLDDNTNEALIKVFLSKSSAQFVAEQYEQKGHKQSYFVHELTHP